MNETKDGGPFEEILEYDIFVNCIRLMKVQIIIQPFTFNVQPQQINAFKLVQFIGSKTLYTVYVGNYLCREVTSLEMAGIRILFRVTNFYRYARLYKSCK